MAGFVGCCLHLSQGAAAKEHTLDGSKISHHLWGEEVSIISIQVEVTVVDFLSQNKKRSQY